jgi:predicted phage terminase large subunit-like protein
MPSVPSFCDSIPDEILSLVTDPDPAIDIAIDAANLAHSFRDFVAGAWPQIVPGETYVHNWHVDSIIEHLEAVRLGQIEGLLINVPPGHSKSILCSILWPAWLWIHHPHWRFICATYAASLATRDAIKMRELVTSDWYQERWGHTVRISPERDTQVDFWTAMRGQRFSTSVGGTLTGQHAHVQIIDDPLNAVDAHSETARDTVNRWVSEALSTRWVPDNKTRQVIIMQRLHERDPTGYLLEQGGYEHLCLRAEYEPGTYVTCLGSYDKRTEPGEALWSALYPPERLAKLKRALGPYGAAGQLQQRPAPAAGGLIKTAQWRYYSSVPDSLDQVAISGDLRFKDDSSSGDYVAFAVLGRKGADIYVLEMLRGRWSFVESCAVLKDLCARYPAAWAKYIENKANGPALKSQLGSQIPGIVLVEPRGDKLQRVHAILPFLAAGNLWLPQRAPWLDVFVAEASAFPNAAHDDQVDALTQGVLEMIDTSSYLDRVTQW